MDDEEKLQYLYEKEKRERKLPRRLSAGVQGIGGMEQ